MARLGRHSVFGVHYHGCVHSGHHSSGDMLAPAKTTD